MTNPLSQGVLCQFLPSFALASLASWTELTAMGLRANMTLHDNAKRMGRLAAGARRLSRGRRNCGL